MSILGWIVETQDNSLHPDTFLLADPKKGKYRLFKMYVVIIVGLDCMQKLIIIYVFSLLYVNMKYMKSLK